MKTTSKSEWKKAGWGCGLSLLAMALIVAGFIFGVFKWLDAYTHHGEAVQVPSVIGIPTDEAMLIIEQAGLKPMIIDSVYTDRRPGTVIEQLPEGTLPVKLGRIVYLTVNARGKQMIEMIDVKDWSSRQAQSRLEEIGFVIESVVYEPYEFDDLVLSVTSSDKEIVAGQKYPIKTPLTLHVGSTTAEIEETNDETEQEWFE